MSKRKRKDLPDSKITYLREIDELEKEISQLESELDQREKYSAQRFPDECLAKIVEKLSHSEDSDVASASNKNSRTRSAQEEELKSFLNIKEKLETLTGFRFVDDKVELISSVDDNNNGSNTKDWRRTLSGTCLDLSFTVVFETEEIEEHLETLEEGQQDQSQAVAKVTKLSININDPIAKEEFETFRVTAEHEKSLSTAFLTLQQYAKWHNCRQRIFKQFETMYPALISFLFGPEHSTFMEIRNSQKLGLHFNICWEIHVDNCGKVVPQIDAFVCSSIENDDADEIMKSTPEQFRKMLSSFGIEQSIELIISIVKG